MFRLTLALCALAALLPAAGSAQAPSTASAKADILAKSTTSWNGKRYTAFPKGQPEMRVIKMTVPANTALPWHTHPFPNAGYVLEGQLTIEDKASGAKHTFRKGQAFTESVDDVHRGVSGPTPAVVVITYAITPGVPTFKAVPGQKPEY
jgi:quercetin dioxygenase-like cupin family protein